MKRQIIRVEPLSTYLERWKAPTSAVTRHGDTLYVSGFPPFDPDTGEVVDAPLERQTELVHGADETLSRDRRSSLDHVLKCNVYCHVGRWLPGRQRGLPPLLPDRPAGAHLHQRAAWPGRFDIEVDCVASIA